MRIEEVSRQEAKVLYEMALLWLRHKRSLYEDVRDSEMVGVGRDICSVFVHVAEEASKNNEPRKVREGEW